jgi:nucleoside triphosphate diphosphatase
MGTTMLRHAVSMADDTPRPHRIEDLLRVMGRLRDPETGCPWDRQQTFATIAPYTIEEAYEVADAIARSDLDGLKDELGDLLLQVVYHARMAEEDGRFAFEDVVDAITAKMIRRHPHVFEDVSLREDFKTRDTWERIKAEEKAARDESTSKGSVLDDVPFALPALARAAKLQSRAEQVGFDWSALAPVLAKAEEEITELKTALASDERDERAPASKKVTEEFGDLLFILANVGRHLGLDPEAALRDANAKFVRRFRSIEAALRAEGRTPEDSTLEEMDQLWDEAKAAESSKQK